MSEILHLSKPVAIGGDTAWRKYQHGDLGVAYHWINGEPSMCLYPLGKRSDQAMPYVIPLPSAYKYVASNGHPDLNYIIPAAQDAASTFGWDPYSRHSIARIIDAICDGMPDLIEMPPEPPSLVDKAVKESMNVGELSIQVDGRKVVETEITSDDAHQMAGGLPQ